MLESRFAGVGITFYNWTKHEMIGNFPKIRNEIIKNMKN